MAVSSLLFFFSILVTSARHFSSRVGGQCLDDQKKLLLELKSEFKLNSSISENMMMWNQTDDDCCRWNGVECDDAGHVTSLSLTNEGISGRIGESSSLFRFTYLSKLYFSANDFTTSYIPNQFHRLKNLTHLYLANDGFIGPIPSSLANLTELLRLDLSGNFLTAPIPSFHLCNKLEEIALHSNNLKGSLSHLHFNGLTNLTFLDLRNNSLNGTIPHHLFRLPSIRSLYLSNNQFSGLINEFSIVNSSNLEVLDLDNNRIEGPFPNLFFQLPSLTSLWLSNNLFDGTFEFQKIRSLLRLKCRVYPTTTYQSKQPT